MPVYLILEWNCGNEFNNLQVKQKICLGSSNVFEFLVHAELTGVSVNMEAISCISSKNVRIKMLLIAHLFVFFLYAIC
jgi:hypothetical protein